MSRKRLLSATLLAATCFSQTASATGFTLEFFELRGGQGERQCLLTFPSAVPAKIEVDALLNQALNLCIAADSSHNIVAMAVSGPDGDTLSDSQESFAFLEYSHKDKQIKRTTSANMWTGAVPIH